MKYEPTKGLCGRHSGWALDMQEIVDQESPAAMPETVFGGNALSAADLSSYPNSPSHTTEHGQWRRWSLFSIAIWTGWNLTPRVDDSVDVTVQQ
jgi:hypothetical protein